MRGELGVPSNVVQIGDIVKGVPPEQRKNFLEIKRFCRAIKTQKYFTIEYLQENQKPIREYIGYMFRELVEDANLSVIISKQKCKKIARDMEESLNVVGEFEKRADINKYYLCASDAETRSGQWKRCCDLLVQIGLTENEAKKFIGKYLLEGTNMGLSLLSDALAIGHFWVEDTGYQKMRRDFPTELQSKEFTHKVCVDWEAKPVKRTISFDEKLQELEACHYIFLIGNYEKLGNDTIVDIFNYSFKSSDISEVIDRIRNEIGRRGLNFSDITKDDLQEIVYGELGSEARRKRERRDKSVILKLLRMMRVTR